MMDLSTQELALLSTFHGVERVERKSSAAFDLRFEGRGADGYAYSAWLPLAAIARLRWTEPAVAVMTDYPEMVLAGDWSGVRDTNDARLWAIFDRFVARGVRVG